MSDQTAAEVSELYLRYRQGDAGAFKDLYSLLSDRLFNYCVRLLGDWHAAEDVLVETFSKFARSDLDHRGNLRAWLYRVATNACYSRFRKQRTEMKCFEAQLREAVGNPGPDFREELRIQRFLNELSDNHRIVVVLKFYEQMTYRDIADMLCCPVGTVKSRMHEGLKKLRVMMEDTR